MGLGEQLGADCGCVVVLLIAAALFAFFGPFGALVLILLLVIAIGVYSR